MAHLSITQATAAQTATVAQFVHALLDELSGGQAPALEQVVETARIVLGDPSVVALIALSGDKPVGAMVLNDCMAIYAGGKFGEISELYVLPEYRSQGVAAALLDHAVALGPARGWKRIEVGAPDQPAWARTFAFYQRNGFEEVGPRLRRVL